MVTLGSMWRGRLLSVRVRLAVRADTPGLGTHNLLVAGSSPAALQSLFFGSPPPTHRLFIVYKSIVGVRIRGARAGCACLRLLIPRTTRKGVGRMSAIKLRLPLLTMLILFVAATGGTSQLGCRELAEQRGCRQSVQW